MVKILHEKDSPYDGNLENILNKEGQKLLICKALYPWNL